MKEINLPISRHFVSRAINLEKAKEDLASKKEVSFGTIDFSCGKELDQARANGGKIIWCAICVEKKLEEIISTYMFPQKVLTNNKGKSFFLTRILNSDLFSYSAKKRLTINIVNEGDLLEGKEKNQLSNVLKKVMEFRNAFAHGDIVYHVDRGCVLKFWQSDPQQAILNDDYWNKIEECFNIAHFLCDQILKKLQSINEFEQVH
jgi:hypothetical protein